MEKILFISELYPQGNDFNSTHTMTLSFLNGLIENNCDVFFLCIKNKDIAQESMADFCYSIGCPFSIVESTLSGKCGKYMMLLDMMKCILHYRGKNNEMKPFYHQKWTIITQSPTIESICIARNIKQHSQAQIIELWSDPITLSGIYSSEYSFKRFPLKVIEARMLSYADKVYYITKPLCDEQKKLFRFATKKIDYLDAPYKGNQKKEPNEKKSLYHFLYAGSYFQNIRNIKPLLHAFQVIDPKYVLDIYGLGDVDIPKRENIVYHGVVPSNEMEQIEYQYQNIISVLNRNSIQIPGKTFYGIDSKKNIIVICDGDQEHLPSILDYLRKYRRFLLCKNDANEIINLLESIREPESISVEQFSPDKVVLKLVNSLSLSDI